MDKSMYSESRWSISPSHLLETIVMAEFELKMIDGEIANDRVMKKMFFSILAQFA
jgi:hypothetical protein